MMSFCEAGSKNECIEEIDHSNVLVQENGRKVNFQNPDRKQYRRIKVDGCLVSQETIADWIVTEIGEASVIVELKGADVKKACAQLFATVVHRDCTAWLEKKIGLLLVCSRVPSFDTSIARAKIEARKKGLALTVKCSKHDCAIADVTGGK